jgi:hypothetical protein
LKPVVITGGGMKPEAKPVKAGETVSISMNASPGSYVISVQPANAKDKPLTGKLTVGAPGMPMGHGGPPMHSGMPMKGMPPGGKMPAGMPPHPGMPGPPPSPPPAPK